MAKIEMTDAGRKAPGFYRLLASVGLATLTACSTSPADRKDESTFCGALLQARIDKVFACEGGSMQALETAVRIIDPCFDTSKLLASGALGLDPDLTDLCLAEMKALPCGLFETPACSKVYVGKVAEGGACFGPECALGSRCVADATCPGTCVRYAQLGDPCDRMNSNGSNTCAPTLYCDSTLVCVTSTFPSPAMIGSPCSGLFDCQVGGDNLVCEGPNGPIDFSLPPTSTDGGVMPGTCQPPTATGPCNYGYQCSSDVCIGANSGASVGTCGQRKVLGDACTPGMRECGPGTTCGTRGTCVQLPSVGQSCAGNTGEGTDCVDGVCDPQGGLCVPFLKAGDPCQPGGFFVDSCSGLRLSCDSNAQICLPTCGPGNACGAPGQICCAGQLCNSGSTCASGICGSAPPADQPGDPCVCGGDSSNCYWYCNSGLTCNTGRGPVACEVPRTNPPGGPCGGNDNCQVDLWCNGGMCSPLLGEGEDCTGGIGCAPGLFCLRNPPGSVGQGGPIPARCTSNTDGGIRDARVTDTASPTNESD